MGSSPERKESLDAMAAKVVVPSDITILEERHTVGKRRLRLFERTGLLGMAPVIHFQYSKMDPGDKRAVLTKKYDADDKSEVVTLLKKRQESIRKEVVAHNYVWGTAGTMAGLTWWSVRRYNYQSRLIALPFIFYGGTFIGRFIGDIATGR